MIRSGLVSITFRALTPEAIVELVARAGLDAIEWGGDVHVPHGDVARARAVRRMTEDAGIAVASYGSYYRVGHGEPVPFAEVVATATALGAPLIRGWAGKRGTAEADAAYWERVIADARHIADLAAAADLVVAFEFHGNTLTDTPAGARRLLAAVDRPNVATYWQPPLGADVAANLASLDAVLPWLTNLHVFSWRVVEGQQRQRLPLAAKADAWRRYLDRAATTGRDHVAMLEFVRDDDPAQFLEDAQTLRSWLASD